MAQICRIHRRRNCSSCHQYRHNPTYWIADDGPGSPSHGSDYDGGNSSSDSGSGWNSGDCGGGGGE